MATTLSLTSDGLSVTAYHDSDRTDIDVSPRYKGEFTLSSSLALTVKFSDVGSGNFNFDVGYVAKGANDVIVSDSGRLHFGGFDRDKDGDYTSPGVDANEDGDYDDDGDIRPDNWWGYDNSISFTTNLSSLTFPITLYFTCGGCDNATTGGDDPIEWQGGIATWKINDGRHTHISKPAAPTISASTGKSITLTGGNDGIQCTTTSSDWDTTSPYTFTGLTQGTSYSFRCRKNCPDCPDGNVYYSDTVTGKTWNISGQCLTAGVSSMVFKATHIAGTNGNAGEHSITYKLFTSKDASKTPVSTKTGNNGIPVTFTGLDPSKTYYCYAYTTNLGSGDNDCWIEGTTKTQATISSNTGDVSAKTLRASVSWNAGDATSVECIVSCNGTNKSLSSSGGYVGFTGLTPNTNYTVSWIVTSTYYYEYTYKVTEDGREVTKTGYVKDIVESVGSASYLTKEATFGTPINVTSKIIQFKSKSNYSGDSMEQKISSNTVWDSVAQNEYTIYNNLDHNSEYTIYCRIAGCYAFNSSGDQTNVNDSEISKTVSTLLLSLSGSISEEHQHYLVTLWQAYVGGVVTDSDAIDGTPFRFTYMDTLAKKNNKPYQAAEVIEGSNGTTTGDYQTDKKVYSNNLTWYYCEYTVTVSITDGYNIVAAAVTAHTIFPASWIYSGGQWHRYIPHVYTNGEYIPAPIFVRKNNNFIEPNGE